MEFLDGSDAVLGTQMFDLRTVVPFPSDSQGEWNQFSVNGTAPANTASVRVSAGATGMMNSGIDPQSAFFDDMALIETLPGAASLRPCPSRVVWCCWGSLLECWASGVAEVVAIRGKLGEKICAARIALKKTIWRMFCDERRS